MNHPRSRRREEADPAHGRPARKHLTPAKTPRTSRRTHPRRVLAGGPPALPPGPRPASLERGRPARKCLVRSAAAVAQTGSLLCRRLATCGRATRFPTLQASRSPAGCQPADTADCQSALRRAGVTPASPRRRRREEADPERGRPATDWVPALECGDLSPLSRGDLSPSNCGRCRRAMGRSRLAPAPTCVRVRTRTAVRRRPVACAKAVTSHRTPKPAGAAPASSRSLVGRASPQRATGLRLLTSAATGIASLSFLPPPTLLHP